MTPVAALNQQTKIKLEQIFRAVFELPADAAVTQLRQADFPKWDSMGHVLLMAAVENEFGIQLEVDTMVSLTSFESVESYLEQSGSDGSNAR